MVYINNNTEPQVVFIPRMESIEYIRPQKGDYTEGFKDGVASQKAKIQSLTITNNGTYRNDDGFSPVVVNVPQGEDVKLQEKNVEVWLSRVVTVTPDEGFDGLSKVNVDAKKYGDIRYNEGVNAQKAKLTDITINKNGTYDNANGYKKVVVDVEGAGHIEGEKIVNIPEDYDWDEDYVEIYPSQGYDAMHHVRVDGEDFARKLIADQEAKLTPSFSINKNGTYDAPYGYKQVVVDVPKEEPILQEKNVKLNYWVEEVVADEGYDGLSKVTMNVQEFWDTAERQGQQYVTDRLVEKTITNNGTYGPDGEKDEWGFKRVVVNVPDRYENGFEAGFKSSKVDSILYHAVNNCYASTGLAFKANSLQDYNGTPIVVYNHYICDNLGFIESRYSNQSGLCTVGEEAFMGQINLRDVNLVTVFFVRDRAFKDCVNLEKVELGSHVQELGADVFNGCSKLTEIVWKFNGQDGYPIVNADTFSGMAESGVIRVPNVEKYSHILPYLPSGWTVQGIE